MRRILCLAVLLTAAGTAPAGEKKALPADLTLVPGSTPLFLAAEVGAVVRGPEADAVKKVSALHPMVITSQLGALDRAVGVRAADVERVLVFGDLSAFVVTTREPLDRKKVQEAVAPGAAEQTAGGKTYAANEARQAVYFADDRTAVIGPPDAIKAALAGPTGQGGPLADAVAAAAARPPLLVGANPAPFRAMAKQAGPAAEPFLPLLAATAWRITFEPADGLRIRLRADFPDADAAKAGAAALQTTLKNAEAEYLPALMDQMPAGLQAQQEKFPGVKELIPRIGTAVKALRAGLKTAAPKTTDRTVETVVRVDTAEPITTAVLLVSLMPRTKKK